MWMNRESQAAAMPALLYFTALLRRIHTDLLRRGDASPPLRIPTGDTRVNQQSQDTAFSASQRAAYFVDEIIAKSHERLLRPVRASAGVRAANLAVILIPFVGFIAAIALLWGIAFDWVHLALFLGMYVVTALGVTVGYHRLFTHKSFETNRFMTFLIGVMGSMAVEGPILNWVATHRCHHQHSDDEHDPHSPHSQGAGFLNMMRGLWHAHAGWLLKPHVPDFDRYVPDLKKDRLVSAISRTFPLWVLLGLVIPTALGGLLTMSWLGALLGFLWGGLVRIFFVHHVTWSVNSVCHLWGRQPYDCHDESRNNFIFGVLGMGEGWHNNHHAFPASARHGLRWWQLDASYLIIRAMTIVGLAHNVRTPSHSHRIAKLRRPHGSNGAPATGSNDKGESSPQGDDRVGTTQ